MEAAAFTEVAMAFFAGITGMNLVINFFQLVIEERKKCSIMDEDEKKKKGILFAKWRRKRYAVLTPARRPA